MLTVAIPKRNKLQNIIVLTPKDGVSIKEEALLLYPEILSSWFWHNASSFITACLRIIL